MIRETLLVICLCTSRDLVHRCVIQSTTSFNTQYLHGRPCTDGVRAHCMLRTEALCNIVGQVAVAESICDSARDAMRTLDAMCLLFSSVHYNPLESGRAMNTYRNRNMLPSIELPLEFQYRRCPALWRHCASTPLSASVLPRGSAYDMRCLH